MIGGEEPRFDARVFERLGADGADAEELPRGKQRIPQRARFAGLYRSPGGDSHVVLLNQRLVLIAPNAASLDNSVRLEPLGNGVFRFTAPGGGGPVGETVRFVEEGGRVVRMYVGDSYVDRVRD